ncbi:hypothetical protein Bccel_4282 [Pseudobacteroides cellulosolvens ATCC 35603 = DSM 2933]|uniref:RNA polymerase subunit sigma-70 n=2 Tax=Oscillospiraceae TaxID=216572 RepID=A0A0L6JT64_9FIRM|nr:hypothetical protein Bccel_4282 [Pseudobacteroides cellulosolvens ATCC 35603 = DSM 2933]
MGESYRQIAIELGISENTIKSYCIRNNLGSVRRELNEKGDYCKQCGRLLVKGKVGHPSKFCSQKCREAWWKANAEIIEKRAWYTIDCACCGKKFDSYGNQKRKFCGHECYIASRFGTRRDECDKGAV